MDPRLEEHLRSLAASHKGYKSRLTFCINVTERTIETARSYQPSQHMLEELKDTRSKLHKAFEKVENSIREMQDLDTDDKFDGYEEKLKAEFKRVMTIVPPMDKLFIELENALKPKIPKAAAAPAAGGGPPCPNPIAH